MLYYILQLFFSFLLFYTFFSTGLFFLVKEDTVNITETNLMALFLLNLLSILISYFFSRFSRRNHASFSIWISSFRFKQKNLALVFFILLFQCIITLIFTGFNSYSFSLRAFIITILFFFFSAFWEEFIFRGFFFRLLSSKRKKRNRERFIYYLIIFQAVLFSLAHIKNPAVNVLKLLNIFLAGIFLGILALQNFKEAVLFHFSWNFLQAFVFGFPVSGYKLENHLLNTNSFLEWEDYYSTGVIFILASLFLFYKKHQKKGISNAI